MQILLTGFLAGLSVGVFCIGICLPSFLPYLLSQEQSLKKSFLAILEFSLGRLLGYFLFGLMIGYLGVAIESDLIHSLASLGMVLLSLVMIGSSLGFISWGEKICGAKLKPLRIPLLLGFFTGINVCPPFLASLSYVFNLREVLGGVVYFSAFFVGTSIYIVPLGFLGLLSQFKFLRKIAPVAGVCSGLIFLLIGIWSLVR